MAYHHDEEWHKVECKLDEEEGEIHSDKGIDIDKWIKDNEEMQEEMF